jgi:hypothetical protein
LLKSEIDKVADKYLGVLYYIIKALQSPISDALTKRFTKKDKIASWHQFINKTYGSLAVDPIERGDQGAYEIREENGDG